MNKMLSKGYRLSRYLNVSWGRWVTLGEYRTLEQAETERNKLVEKGYRREDTSVAWFDDGTEPC